MPKKKNDYTVVGNHEINGHPPGSTFSSDMSDEHAQQLIDAGHLKAGKEANDG
jgi:hypothetical protein